MRRTMFARAGRILALVGCCLGLGGACTDPNAIAAQNLMVGFNNWVSPTNVALQAKTGVNTRRIFVFWNQLSPQRGTWNWTDFDAAYNHLVAAGIHPLIDITNAPCWAYPSVPCNNASYTGPPDPSFEGDWEQMVRKVTQRYPQAVGFEIWNEPNIVWDFYPQVDPARYTRLLREAYETIRSIRATVPVISGGLTDWAQYGYAVMGYQQFITGMYQAGAGAYMNGLTMHIYPTSTSSGAYSWDPSQFETILNNVRGIRSQFGGTQPLWVTELGESTAGGGDLPVPVTPQQQASDIMQMLGEARADADVAGVMIHQLNDDVSTQGFGAFDSLGNPKPLACSLSASFGGSLGC